MGKHLADLDTAQRADIVLMVKQAKKPWEQVGICADLYQCTKGTIKAVLREAGMEPPEKPEPTYKKPESPKPTCKKVEHADVTIGPTEAARPFERAAIILSILRPDDTREVKAAAVSLVEAIVGAEVMELIGGAV